MGESRFVWCYIEGTDCDGTDQAVRRQELLAWLNGLLQLNLTKVEQCGTGYA